MKKKKQQQKKQTKKKKKKKTSQGMTRPTKPYEQQRLRPACTSAQSSLIACSFYRLRDILKKIKKNPCHTRWMNRPSPCWSHIWALSYKNVYSGRACIRAFAVHLLNYWTQENVYIEGNSSDEVMWIFRMNLTDWRLETPKWVTGKQCRLRSDTAECI